LGEARTRRRSEIPAWTEDNLLRQVVYEGLRDDKPASEIRRDVPHPKLATGGRSDAVNKPPARHSR
jgi:hypothetical protein